MTTSKVMQIMSQLKSPELPGMQKQTQETDIAFGALLSQTSGGREQDLFSAGSVERPAKNDAVNQTAYEKEYAKSGFRENAVSSSKPADAQSKLPEDTAEKLQAFDKQVKEVIAEKLGISEEEITQQMEAMGLTVMDLMDPSKLAGLVMNLTGSEDIGGLLFNADFQQMMAQIGELSQELALQLNLMPEELAQLTDQLKLMVSEQPQPGAEISAEAGQMTSEGEIPVQDAADVPTEQMKDGVVLQDAAATAQTNTQTASEEVPAQADTVQTEEGQRDNDSVAAAQTQESAENQEEAESPETGGKPSELLKESAGNDKAESKQTHITYQTTTQNVGQGQTVEVTQTVVQTRVDVEDILRQVSQMTRVFVSQAESSVEMQLNPANLGKIYLQVVSREGVITAQIAAQNEAVKEALESQVAVLKENMNQQGMKVEAIEVTIASHEFERNLEQNQQNAAREQQEEEAAKAGRRNLNLNSLDEMEGLMSEEESLAAKMMAEQGNSMDITA